MSSSWPCAISQKHRMRLKFATGCSRIERAVSAGWPLRHHDRQHRHQHLSRPREYDGSVVAQCGYGAPGGKTRRRRRGADLFPSFGATDPAGGRDGRRPGQRSRAESSSAWFTNPSSPLDKEIVGFEALLRWKHPAWGQISPLEFIPTAERSGLIVPIGDWVIDEVCRQAMEWNAAAVRPVKMFANVSGVQLETPRL